MAKVSGENVFYMTALILVVVILIGGGYSGAVEDQRDREFKQMEYLDAEQTLQKAMPKIQHCSGHINDLNAEDCFQALSQGLDAAEIVKDRLNNKH